MADVFSILKWKNIDCEMVSEFAKDLVWENRQETFKDEVYIFAKQNHRLFRVKGKVDVVITDRPLILTMLYNNRYGNKSKALDELVMDEFSKYDNLNYFISRKKPYSANGRNQSEGESDNIAMAIKEILRAKGIKHKDMDGVPDAADSIVDDILLRLNGDSHD